MVGGMRRMRIDRNRLKTITFTLRKLVARCREPCQHELYHSFSCTA